MAKKFVYLFKEGDATMRELLDHGTTQYTERVLDVYSRMSYDMSQWENAAKAYRQLYDITQDGKRREVIAEGYVDATLKYATGEQIIGMADDVGVQHIKKEHRFH